MKITDVTSCYRIYNIKIIKKIIKGMKEDQYYAIEILRLVLINNGKVIEVPIKDISRLHDKSKKGLLRYFVNLLRVILKTV